MKLPEATRDALKKYLTGEAHHPALTPTTRRMLEVFLLADENHDELEALRIAEEHADFEPLAKLIEITGELRTPDARTFVAARLRGKKRRPGNKLTEENMLRRIRLVHRVWDLENERKMTQSQALNHCLADDGSLAQYSGFETIRSDFQRGRSEFHDVLEKLGFPIGPELLTKNTNGEKR
ncbi:MULTISPECIES: hypothetical protein [unclassified Aliiroseovarius]|uniref:hypothetical protein n=1 Tax=unclassified Aliiroseovarius TaxID=2623558 RepID=UPI001569B462|nr:MULTISPECIES: hypothetical protein [unclassified Aliiroseovarius]NRP13974.1 hypothetical protein [Aliiroseovarius sp. xm-d-517]NRP41861.1 hypothetical protein [Aliiroseovarius sp. xm-m-339-2]NRP62867.1 hypothetical protein [Aliiroseovarius sp. xm-a-151]